MDLDELLKSGSRKELMLEGDWGKLPWATSGQELHSTFSHRSRSFSRNHLSLLRRSQNGKFIDLISWVCGRNGTTGKDPRKRDYATRPRTA